MGKGLVYRYRYSLIIFFSEKIGYAVDAGSAACDESVVGPLGPSQCIHCQAEVGSSRHVLCRWRYWYV